MKFHTQVFNAVQKPDINEKSKIVDFLFDHLDQFGDKKEDILKAIDFSVKDSASFGGFTLMATDGENVVGAVVVNQTGMQGYIPENILVYIAVHRDLRGQGIGKVLMTEAINLAKGDIALHVEPDNPARHLYQKLGFDNKYLEMRLKKSAV
ncbi:MAG: GNAT family N-acetyltransferase [Bacteroidetes bacterium HGW-Bacteroidetes-11]|jgi:ribosomal protein S18 acetylase RimI-like enzyme|nr:MAG: GNAT family N-acetyltransferase [Bacteroidetes bacterium HGW-Bacteroidetes-11]